MGRPERSPQDLEARLEPFTLEDVRRVVREELAAFFGHLPRRAPAPASAPEPDPAGEAAYFLLSGTPGQVRDKIARETDVDVVARALQVETNTAELRRPGISTLLEMRLREMVAAEGEAD